MMDSFEFKICSRVYVNIPPFISLEPTVLLVNDRPCLDFSPFSSYLKTVTS